MSTPANAGPASAPTPRFSWPMRIFLGFLLFDIVGHSLMTLSPYRDWLESKDIPRFPRRLPTWDEVADAEAKGTADWSDDIFASLDSAWDYFKPWPAKKVRQQLEGPADQAMYALSWLSSRLDFVEAAVGISQRWTMFSPNATKETTVARFRLYYADDSSLVYRVLADPEDLTHYSHWFEEKLLDCELRVPYDYDARVGFCNFLAHRYAKNSAGAPLQSIYIYKIPYRYPGPHEDAVAVLRSQNGPPNWDADGPTWRYDPISRESHKLSEAERKNARTQLLGKDVSSLRPAY